MKKFRGTFVALAIVLILAAYIMFTERGKPTTDSSEGTVFGVRQDTVQEISIEHDGAKVSVKKDDSGRWAIVAPKPYVTSQEAVESLVDAIAQAEFDKEIEAEPSDLGLYGLGSPITRVEVKGAKGNKKVLLIGSATPVGSGYYVKPADDSKVCTIPTTLANDLMKTADDLRERKIIKVSSESVEGIRIVGRMGEDVTDVMCEKRDGDWNLIRPIPDRADRWKITELIWDITGLVAEDSVDDEGLELSRWGLDSPRLRIDLIVAETGEPVQVFVGDPGPDEEGFYVKAGESPAVYLVKPSTFLPLELTPPDLVDSQLAVWNHDEVIAVTWILDNKTFSLIRDGKGWKINPKVSVSGRADAVWEGEKLEMLRTTLQDIQVTGVGEILRPEIDLAAFGLDNPDVSVQFDLGDGNTFELKIGKEIEEGFYATVTDRYFVYLVKKDGIEALENVLREISS